MLATLPSTWQSISWVDYLKVRDQSDLTRIRLWFWRGLAWMDEMGWEGVNHAAFCDLFTLMLGFWLSQHPDPTLTLMGRCLMEREPEVAVAPDLMVYVGDDYPRWQVGEPRRIDLTRIRPPDLVGEISDTTLAMDLDEKKQLYAALGIPEYWVIDVQGRRVFAFRLNSDLQKYQPIDQSITLAGLPISLLEQTLTQLEFGSNGNAALWFLQQLQASV